MSIAIFYLIARAFAHFAYSTLNPAFTLAMTIQYATKGNWTSFANCWAWFLGDLIGCIIAIYFYELIYEPIVRELRDIRRRS
jgi:glycerol uptake facilitator-like aquaporin